MNTTTDININRTISFEMHKPKMATASTGKNGNPWEPRKLSSYKDLTLQPECLSRKMRFQEGDNWVRVVPPLSGSKFEWMMAIHALDFEGGRFAHPKTLRAGAKCVYDEAYEWAKHNCPSGLYTKANKSGVRLLSDPLSLCWIIAEESSQPVARLLVASGYDGSRGGTPGLGWRIWKAIIDHDTSKSPVPDAVHPDTGVRICINKAKVKGNPRPIYTVGVGRQPSPILPLLNAMSPEERALLTPLENVVRILTDEQEWECLAKVMAPDTVNQIKAEITLV